MHAVSSAVVFLVVSAFACAALECDSIERCGGRYCCDGERVDLAEALAADSAARAVHAQARSLRVPANILMSGAGACIAFNVFQSAMPRGEPVKPLWYVGASLLACTIPVGLMAGTRQKEAVETYNRNRRAGVLRVRNLRLAALGVTVEGVF